MDTTRVHPPSDHDDTVEAHHSGLERLGCATCYRGIVYLTYEEDGHEWTEPVPCRRCSSR